MKSLALLLLLFPFTCLAQFNINGKVINHADKTPVADASVFLSNTMVGAKTNDKGEFTLTGVKPGQYDLVVSIVGYETSHQNLMANNNSSLPAIELTPKTIVLNEVRIGTDPNWARNFERFKRLFFGTSANAEQCKILNPDLLTINYDNTKYVLTASSYDFLEIDNKALGYKLKYLVSSFTNDGRSGELYFEGSVAFENLKGSASQLRRWGKARLKAYRGSSMHFLRSAVSNDFDDEGFRAFRLVRKPNPGYQGFGPKYLQTLVTTPLTINDFMRLTDVKGLFALSFNDCLYITYHEKKPKGHEKDDVPTEFAAPTLPADCTIITFKQPYAFFDNNGIITNPRSIVFEGNWGQSLVADLLPVDYEEPAKADVKK